MIFQGGNSIVRMIISRWDLVNVSLNGAIYILFIVKTYPNVYRAPCPMTLKWLESKITDWCGNSRKMNYDICKWMWTQATQDAVRWNNPHSCFLSFTMYMYYCSGAYRPNISPPPSPSLYRSSSVLTRYSWSSINVTVVVALGRGGQLWIERVLTVPTHPRWANN